MYIRSSRVAAFPLRDQAVGLTEAGALEGVADASGIGEARLAHAPRHQLAEGRFRRGGEGVVLAIEHDPRDRHQRIQFVVGEIDVVGDP